MTGAYDEDHLQNLAEVLRHLQLHDITMKKSKSYFIGCVSRHQIDSEGHHATVDKGNGESPNS